MQATPFVPSSNNPFGRQDRRSTSRSGIDWAAPFEDRSRATNGAVQENGNAKGSARPLKDKSEWKTCRGEETQAGGLVTDSARHGERPSSEGTRVGQGSLLWKRGAGRLSGSDRSFLHERNVGRIQSIGSAKRSSVPQFMKATAAQRRQATQLHRADSEESTQFPDTGRQLQRNNPQSRTASSGICAPEGPRTVDVRGPKSFWATSNAHPRTSGIPLDDREPAPSDPECPISQSGGVRQVHTDFSRSAITPPAMVKRAREPPERGRELQGEEDTTKRVFSIPHSPGVMARPAGPTQSLRYQRDPQGPETLEYPPSPQKEHYQSAGTTKGSMPQIQHTRQSLNAPRDPSFQREIWNEQDLRLEKELDPRGPLQNRCLAQSRPLGLQIQPSPYGGSATHALYGRVGQVEDGVSHERWSEGRPEHEGHSLRKWKATEVSATHLETGEHSATHFGRSSGKQLVKQGHSGRSISPSKRQKPAGYRAVARDTVQGVRNASVKELPNGNLDGLLPANCQECGGLVKSGRITAPVDWPSYAARNSPDDEVGAKGGSGGGFRRPAAVEGQTPPFASRSRPEGCHRGAPLWETTPACRVKHARPLAEVTNSRNTQDTCHHPRVYGDTSYTAQRVTEKDGEGAGRALSPVCGPFATGRDFPAVNHGDIGSATEHGYVSQAPRGDSASETSSKGHQGEGNRNFGDADDDATGHSSGRSRPVTQEWDEGSPLRGQSQSRAHEPPPYEDRPGASHAHMDKYLSSQLRRVLDTQPHQLAVYTPPPPLQQARRVGAGCPYDGAKGFPSAMFEEDKRRWRLFEKLREQTQQSMGEQGTTPGEDVRGHARETRGHYPQHPQQQHQRPYALASSGPLPTSNALPPPPPPPPPAGHKNPKPRKVGKTLQENFQLWMELNGHK